MHAVSSSLHPLNARSLPCRRTEDLNAEKNWELTADGAVARRLCILARAQAVHRTAVLGSELTRQRVSVSAQFREDLVDQQLCVGLAQAAFVDQADHLLVGDPLRRREIGKHTRLHGRT